MMEPEKPSPNRHVRDELEHFRQAPGRAFYALQIDAPWGAGKSHFVSAYLKDATPDTPNEDGPLSIRVTLFGAQSIADLESQVVAQIFSRTDRVLGTIVSGFISGAARRYQADQFAGDAVSAARKTAVDNRLKRVRGGLIVFDDLERSRIPLKEALGYVNRFVETEGCKVVLVSNEDAFFRPDASDEDRANGAVLKAFKEKLVGRTLRLTADPDGAFDSFAAEMRNAEARDAAGEHKAAILQVFRASGRENLRALRAGLEAFDRVAAILSPRVLSKGQALREIALCCTYVAIELAAAVDEAVVSDPTAGLIKRLVAGVGAGKGAKPSAAEDLADDIAKRYDGLVNLQRPAVPLSLLVRFVAHGQLDASQVTAAAEVSPLVADPEDLPPWRALVHIWDLDVEDLQANTVRALRQLRALEVLDPGELLHLAGVMLWRAHYEDLTLSEGSSPLDFVEGYLDRLHASGQCLRAPFAEGRGSAVAAYGIVAIAPDERQSELLRIRDLIRGSVDRSVKARFPEMRERLMEHLRAPDRLLQRSYGGSNELASYAQMSVFEDAEPTEFADVVLRGGRFDFAALDWLCGRYKLAGETILLVAEGRWLRGLARELLARADAAPPPFNRVWAEASDGRLAPLLARLDEIPRSRRKDESRRTHVTGQGEGDGEDC